MTKRRGFSEFGFRHSNLIRGFEFRHSDFPAGGSLATYPTPLGLQPSFGFGDRIGLATPGHVEAMKRAGKGIAPIFVQQSIREMTRTNRTPQQVMADALQGVEESGYKGVHGADADHLKTPA